ncbi:hypothetical protein [Dyella silvatica]|uniref:hypothetical protein n=1 Tax=Dyella silvatica TaxID=2992128 RepID=UPI00224E5A45|nr:hypothetical protein [Dyella silvatica]
MDGSASAVKKVSVQELYERLRVLDKEHSPRSAPWSQGALRVLAILMAAMAVLAVLSFVLNPVVMPYVVRCFSLLSIAVYIACGVIALTALIRRIPWAWSPFKHHAKDIDDQLGYERGLIALFSQCESNDLKEVAGRIEVELKIVTRRMNIFTVSAGLASLCFVVVSKWPHNTVPFVMDDSTLSQVVGALVVVNAMLAMTLISMASQLERMSFILARAADAPKG